MSAPIDAQELREALEARARFDDTAALARLSSVQHRVRVVRRRRRVALAAAAAAVVAAAGGIAALAPGEREVAPVSRTFGDLTAPKTLRSSGAVYTFDRMVTGTSEVRLTASATTPALVTWASAGEGPALISRTTDDEGPYASTDDFRDFLVLPAGDDARTITAAGKGRLALAVYELSEPAQGNTADINGTPVVLRNEVPGFDGITSAWGAPGATDVTVRFAYPEGTLETASFCSGAPDYDFHVDIEGPGSFGACADEPSVAGPGDRIGYTDGLERRDGSVVKPGEQVTAHLWLSRKGSDEPVDGPLPGVRMGAVFYETDAPVATIGEFPLTELREDAGHTWRFVKVIAHDEPARELSTNLDPGGDRPSLVVFTSGTGAGMVRVWVDGEEGTSYSDDTAGGTFLGGTGPLGSGDHLLKLRAQRPTTFGIAVYELVD